MKATKQTPKKTNRSAAPQLYQLKVTLVDTKPPIWRRLVVRGDTTLARLHTILQFAMGWEDYHLHTFTIRGTDYSDPDPEWDPPVADERKATLTGLSLRARSKFQYLYDMGDSWEHEIVVEAMKDAETMWPPHAVCMAGARACPPEDVGGTGGYECFLEAICDPEDEEHREMLEWVGGEFDPEAFDVAATNEAVKCA